MKCDPRVDVYGEALFFGVSICRLFASAEGLNARQIIWEGLINVWTGSITSRWDDYLGDSMCDATQSIPHTFSQRFRKGHESLLLNKADPL